MPRVIPIVGGRTGMRGHGAGPPVRSTVPKRPAGETGGFAGAAAVRGGVLAVA